jgi:hypothetical protein
LFSGKLVNVTDAENNNFNGHIKSGKRDGLGTMKYANGDFYQGFWENDLKEGEGNINSFLIYSGSRLM